jgi:spore maturation protein CgeB
MRILVAGDWYSEVHEEGVYQAYKKIGHEVFRFSWHQYFKLETAPSFVSKIQSFCKKFQDKFIVGPIIQNINRDFIKAVDACNPDVISLYRGTHIRKETLRSIKKSHPSTRIICHNEDDPFTEGHPYWLWRHFLASIPEYDLVLAHRKRNVQQYRESGARHVKFLRSWYAPERVHPVTLSTDVCGTL